MIKQSHYNAYLREISPGAAAHTTPTCHPLSTNQSIVIGQDPNCQIVLNPTNYLGVSNRHLEIRPLMPQPSGSIPCWQVYDLGSSNGTYVNNQRLQGFRTLQVGDRISLGQQGVEFIFECQVSTPGLPGSPLNIQSGDSLHLSQILPIISTRQDLFKKAYLIPGVLTVLLVVGLFAVRGQPQVFNPLLAIYLIGAGYYFIYQLGGKSKPWWLLLGSAITTILLLKSPVLNLFFFVFREILPGEIPEGTEIGFLPSFIHMFFGAGMMEELLKALPVFAALGTGRMLRSPWRERVGVWEPLDGILLATASAVGFTLLETLEQYVPNTVQQVATQAGEGVGELYGIQVLIPRIIGSVAGHMAYSGYFGYFIGLSVLKPSRRWSILAIGYLTAALLHALWNASGAISYISDLVLAFAGVLAYAFLMAAILKARQLSPIRSQNWATQYYSPPPLSQAPFSLRIQQRTIPLTAGTGLQAREIAGLGAQGANGVVAEVNANPKDPSILGLQNCSHQVWIATLANGQQKQIDPSRSIKLIVGTKINFGSVQGEIK
jgi:RsiW-degrading membrane proteinase PrsW (M82 family)